jgi:hypothetical protein
MHLSSVQKLAIPEDPGGITGRTGTIAECFGTNPQDLDITYSTGGLTFAQNGKKTLATEHSRPFYG